MVLSFLKLALTISLPLVLLIGTYDLKVLMTLSSVQFTLFFVDFWFQLARWMDKHHLECPVRLAHATQQFQSIDGAE